MIKLVDARKGLYEKCVELFHDKKVAESIYMYLCDGIEECDEVELERKKGEWVKAFDGYYGHVKCNKCFKTYDWTMEAQYFDFCPNCGADMRGGDDDV